MNDTGTYKRGQVEWALWSLFTRAGHAQQAPIAPVFRTRIKRLLEIDRDTALELDGVKLPAAFVDSPGEGTGTDLPYTEFNAFCLALGLDLLDVGLKQFEIVFLIKHIRPALQIEFERMRRSPYSRMARPAEDFPECPSYTRRGLRLADCRVFALIEKLDLKEIRPGASNEEYPMIFEPTFCRGLRALQREMDKLSHQRRKVLVLELGNTAALIREHLAKAPVVKRGRK